MSAKVAETDKLATTSSSPKIVEAHDIFDDLRQLTKSIEKRAYELFHFRGGEPGRELEDWFKAESELMRPVMCELKEADDHLTVQAEVPGFTANNLKISVEPYRLFIRGSKISEKKDEKENTVYTERKSNEIFRTLYLPVQVDPAKATAEMKNGMLNIMLPKVNDANQINIEVKNK